MKTKYPAVHPKITPIASITHIIQSAHPEGKINWNKNIESTVTTNKVNIKEVYWDNLFPRIQLKSPKAINIIAKI